LRAGGAGQSRSAGRTGESEGVLMASETQVAIVTGAASGIGRAMTLGLLEEGICVLGVDREPVWLGELEEEADDRELAGSLHTILGDLTDPTSFGGIVSTALRAFGRSDILVNNAGIGHGTIRADLGRFPSGRLRPRVEPLRRGQRERAADDGARGRPAYVAQQMRPYHQRHNWALGDAPRRLDALRRE
jgi:NAD(P)-dependent dehydrogenase (short-subunit alcohol dehydrogenase family)